ncbi:hypothetical protein MNAN1_003768 [Malassezia nana]|uniref:Uncharacterized protein n=1 Tax=Malassezia nana TaxID=180528 RepID=A0AAF0EPW9_9BASI|nr:hypothetical protein MNAN1_003768 [Malassezia nana]
MLHSRALTQENDLDALSPMRTPGARYIQSFSPKKTGSSRTSPFKRGDRGKSAIGGSHTVRSAFGDKTNQSPAKPSARSVSPVKAPAPKLAPPSPWTASAAPRTLSDDELYPPVGARPALLPARGTLVDALTLDMPYDFSPALEGLPRASQAAAMLAGAPLLGPSRSAAPVPVLVDASDLCTTPPARAAPAPRRAPPAGRPGVRPRAVPRPRPDVLARQADTLARSGVVDQFFPL